MDICQLICLLNMSLDSDIKTGDSIRGMFEMRTDKSILLGLWFS